MRMADTSNGIMNPTELLKKHFGHDAFRPGQETLVSALLSGRDVLGVMPTGAGKSVCYQIPALMLPGVTLVVSPLISLMKDQVANLIEAGIPAAYINSTLSPVQQREALRRAAKGAYKLIYVAPERLLSDGFFSFAAQAEISLVAVDEAHCVSQWGQDFRPSYLDIARFVQALPKRPKMGAFTATATQSVKKDVIELLGLNDPLTLTTGFDRPNLWFSVEQPKDKLTWLKRYLERRQDQSGIVYCATRKTVEEVCAALQETGCLASRYHAGLEDRERRKNQEDFSYDRVTVMVATNAFGMGIDKSNVSFVVHYNMPKNMESYYQEAGRAGRDGAPAECILLFSMQDVRTARYLIENSDREEVPEELRDVLLQRDLRRMQDMVDYCRTADCLRSRILRYFGENAPERCGHCGNCDKNFTQTDVTTEAKMILSCVRRIEQRTYNSLGITLISEILHGSRERSILDRHFDELSTYGLMREKSLPEIKELMEALIQRGYLNRSEDQYRLIRTTALADQILFHGQELWIPLEQKPGKDKKTSAGKPKSRRDRSRKTHPDGTENTLFDALRALRFQLAQEAGVPAYVIFSNATLRDMADRQPHTMDQLLQVSGVGEVKAAKYGKQFLQAIRSWEDA